jgi:hemerythrin
MAKMAFIDWSDALSVGFEEVDQDHKKLVEIVNSLDEAVSGEPNSDLLKGIFAELLSYTQWHFRHEERLMQNCGYPDFFVHKEAHEDLLGQASELNEKFQGGDASVPQSLLPFLKDWLTKHILETDKKMGEYLAQKAG